MRSNHAARIGSTEEAIMTLRTIGLISTLVLELLAAPLPVEAPRCLTRLTHGMRWPIAACCSSGDRAMQDLRHRCSGVTWRGVVVVSGVGRYASLRVAPVDQC